MKITFQTPPKNLDEKMIYNVLRDYKILNCEVLVRDENGTLKPTALGVYSRLQTPY
jgi:ribosome-interacting GTPase 1